MSVNTRLACIGVSWIVRVRYLAQTLLLTRNNCGLLFLEAERCGKMGRTMSYKMKAAALVACMLAIGVASTPQKASAQACDGDPQKTALARPIPMGISGGNIHSFLRKKVNNKIKGCFGGTLGSMVQDSSLTQFILSNNHVLADQNTAKAGDRIVQPGLNDVLCFKSSTNSVATFSKAIHINFAGGKNTVDAAIAAV